MQTPSISEKLSLLHASMLASANAFPSFQGYKNPTRDRLFMLANEFRPYIALSAKHPEQFESLLGNYLPVLMKVGKRGGRYVRAFVRALAGEPLSRYELCAVVGAIKQGMTSHDDIIAACIAVGPSKSTAIQDARRVLRVLWSLDLISPSYAVIRPTDSPERRMIWGAIAASC